MPCPPHYQHFPLCRPLSSPLGTASRYISFRYFFFFRLFRLPPVTSLTKLASTPTFETSHHEIKVSHKIIKPRSRGKITEMGPIEFGPVCRKIGRVCVYLSAVCVCVCVCVSVVCVYVCVSLSFALLCYDSPIASLWVDVAQSFESIRP